MITEELSEVDQLNQIIGARDSEIARLKSQIAQLTRHVSPSLEMSTLIQQRKDIGEHIRGWALNEDGTVRQEVIDEALAGEDFIPWKVDVSEDFVAHLVSTRYILRRKKT